MWIGWVSFSWRFSCRRHQRHRHHLSSSVSVELLGTRQSQMQLHLDIARWGWLAWCFTSILQACHYHVADGNIELGPPWTTTWLMDVHGNYPCNILLHHVNTFAMKTTHVNSSISTQYSNILNQLRSWHSECSCVCCFHLLPLASFLQFLGSSPGLVSRACRPRVRQSSPHGLKCSWRTKRHLRS